MSRYGGLVLTWPNVGLPASSLAPRPRSAALLLPGIDQLATCTCAAAPGLSAVPGRMTRYCFAEGSLLSTICRIGPLALTVAPPAGLVMNLVSVCSGPLPSGFVEGDRT